MPFINRDNLRNSHQLPWLILDLVMLFLLVINLTWLIMDSLYAVQAVRELLQDWLPGMTQAYAPIHHRFIFYDMVFVGIFLTEFVVRWVHAVRHRMYARWYFYPFIHWYDLIGCIPIGTYRFLRLLRLISIIYRLHQHKIIDFTRTRLYRFLAFYYDVFMEELTDRIVIKVLSGAQQEVREGSPLIHHIQQKVLLPRRALLESFLSERLAIATQAGYGPHRAALRQYLADKVDTALRQNSEVRRLRLLPLVGPALGHALENAVGDIVATVIEGTLDDMASTANHPFIHDLTAAFLYEKDEPESAEVRQEMIDVVVEILELVKAQVAVKRWRAALD
ncbi:MAG: hypothetical protein LPK85_09965 [Gammaproteobacteria bacterium]|nr:hypothetical protein [Gammaproteobacteria bacterium]